MKKVALMLAVIALMNSAFADTHSKKMKSCKKAKTETSMKTVPHVCTSACMNGKHVYKHGETGHVCTDACKKM